MIKLKRYLKPFIFGLILSVILLFGQAVADLSLPNYMSDIVNIGIQQSGIERAAPDAISENAMRLMTGFMNQDERALTESAYTLVSKTDKNADNKSYGDLYPSAPEKLYVKNDTGDADELDTAFGTATWTFIYTVQDLAAQSEQEQNLSFDSSDIDLSMLYQMQQVFDALPQQLKDAAHDKALSNDGSLLNQSGVMMSTAFLSELGVDLGSIQSAYILKIGFFMLLITLAGGTATVLVSLFSSKIAAGVARNLRRDVFSKIESFSSGEFDRFSTASLITRCTNDITQIQMLLMIGIRLICYAPIMGIGGTIMAVNKSASMSWIIAAACVVLIGLILVIMSIALPKFKLIQKLVDRLNLVSRENLGGMMVIRAFSAQEHEKKRFDDANVDLTRTSLFINRVMAFMMPAMMLIMNGISLVILWVGAHQIAQSALQIGDMMAFIQYSMQIIMAFLMISMMFIFVPRAAVSAERISEVLDIKNSIEDPKKKKAFDPGKKGFLEFRDVNFRYNGAEEDVLHNISFTAEPGKTTAIIGPTGSGKSTIASLALRFYDVGGGVVLLDGTDVREVSQKDLRAKIGYVPQKGVLLSGTIASNLRYGKPEAANSEVEEAARTAMAAGFISEKPEGFESLIAQGGTNVSGGQKQRLSIARALVKRPEIYIFDDSFSALDFKTDAALRRALKENTGDSTVLIIAQRVNTIMDAEQIIVLDEGRIVGKGTHKELLKSCPQYYEIALSQLSKEELA